ncbi:hypothetical protein BT96DRAFT_978032 [Gymnopus androsaceus JB14]|uniref:BTB domain-containing protein n=1 Tax=Gymnopus androsaceus JB14 TaxID=1447944 RepID=A0A6A4HC43_9AGAR|nr:hypothetical protein BT96DRAFT_978032 [Gymnopus androsaceus JB14]
MSDTGTLSPGGASSAVQSSKIFNATDADVVIRSADNVDFRLHKANLACATGAFPPPETNSDEIVHLTESSETLEILFQFIYPRRFPSLEKMNFDSLMLLAEAAEKYEVVALIAVCDFNLRKFLPTQPKKILEFAANHDYPELIMKIAPLLAHTPLSKLVDILPYHVYKPWSLFREQWLIATKGVFGEISEHCCQDGSRQRPGSLTLHILVQLAKPIEPTPARLDSIFDYRNNGYDSCCAAAATEWKTKIQAKLDRVRQALQLTLIPSK